MTKQMIVMSSASTTSILAGFIEDSLAKIMIWLLVMFCVILADAASACYRAYKREDETIKLTKGMRDTMAKIVVYFSFVVAIVFVGQAAEEPNLCKWACLAVMIGEGVSVAGNMLKAHYYELNVKELVNKIGSKANIDNAGEIIEKEK